MDESPGKIGFVLAAAASAVGVGTVDFIWRPRMAAVVRLAIFHYKNSEMHQLNAKTFLLSFEFLF